MVAVQSLGALATVEGSRRAMSGGGSLRLYSTYYQTYEQLYEKQPNVRTCVDFLARNIAQLGLHVYQRKGETDRVRLREHPLALLLQKPLPAEYKVTRYRLIESLISDLGIYFNAYWIKVRASAGTMGLLRVPPGLMTVYGKLWPVRYEMYTGGTPRSFMPEEIVHFRGYNPSNPIFGLSPLETLRRVLAEEYAMGEYREHFWSNAARINGIIERPAPGPGVTEWSHTAKTRFIEEFGQFYSTPGNFGKTPVLEDGMTWKAQAFNAQESEYLAGRKLTREECARAYHIPLPMVGILDHATFCLPGHVLVFTSRGPRPIEGIETGDLVWSHSGQRFDLRRVERVGQTGIDPILRIKTQNRTLEANAKHPLLVRRLVPKPGVADEEADAKTRAGQSRWHYEVEHVFVPAGQIRRGDVLVAAGELPGVRPDDESIGRMEFYGLYLGDGNLMRNRGQPCGVAISRATDAPYMDHYREEMARFTGRGQRSVTLDDAGQPRQTRFMSADAARLMLERGFGGTAHTKRVPWWVFQASEEARLAFLRGYLDSDGSVDKRGKISFSSCNQALIEDIRHLCMSVGVPVNNAYHRVAKDRSLPNGSTCDIDQWAITCADPEANREIGSHHPRHQERLSRGVGWQKKGKAYPFAGGRRSEPPAGCTYSRVVSVVELPPEPVYDLCVEGNHNFIAAGLVVHNSNIKEQHRNLYQDSLGPWLAMVEGDIDLQLTGDFEDVKGVYVEFNIQEKLQGSFEEQIQSLQSAVGRPWMAPDEARARQNMSAMGGDAARLAVPLNVMVGGLASPRDTGPKEINATGAKGARDANGEETKEGAEGEIDPTQPGLRERHVEKWTQAMQHAFERQQRAIIGKVPEKAAKATVDEVWDKERWDRELTEDIFRLNTATATVWMRYVLKELGGETDEQAVSDGMLEWLAENARVSAEGINAETAAGIGTALEEPEPRNAVKDLFLGYLAARALQIAVSKVTAASNFGAREGARAGGLKTKTWRVNSPNPRPAHASLDGVTIGINEKFGTGQLWPGDPAGGADNNAGCTCSVVFGR